MKRIKNLNKMSLSFKEEEMYIRKYLDSKMSGTVYIKELIVEDMKRQGIWEELKDEN